MKRADFFITQKGGYSYSNFVNFCKLDVLVESVYHVNALDIHIHHELTFLSFNRFGYH